MFTKRMASDCQDVRSHSQKWASVFQEASSNRATLYFLIPPNTIKAMSTMSASKKKVVITSLNKPFYAKRFKVARRLASSS